MTTPLDPHLFGAQPCFGCAQDHPIGFRLRFARDDDTIVTRFTPEDRYQGPPGLMHGGLVTTLADEIAAWTIVGLRERFGFTAAIECRLLAPIYIGQEVIGKGRVTGETARTVKIEVTLDQAEKKAFRGVFTFALLDQAAAERVLGGSLPEAWRRFSR